MGFLDRFRRKRHAGYHVGWIIEKIDFYAPGDDPSALGHLLTACVTLADPDRFPGPPTHLFGVELSVEDRTNLASSPEREAVLAHALETVRAWLRVARPRQVVEIAECAAYANLPIDVSERQRELAAEAAVVERELAEAAAFETRHAELEAVLFTDRDSALVLADLLQQHGDPRGELIALQIAAEDTPAQATAVKRHLSQHVTRLLGPLAPFQHTGRDDVDAFTWRRGYIHRAYLAYAEDGEMTNAHVLDRLLRHPSGRYLAELVLGIDTMVDEHDDVEQIVDVLATRGAPALRLLHVGAFAFPQECSISWYNVGDLSRLWSAVPRLDTLVVQGAAIELGAIEHAALARLELRTGGLPATAARAICSLRTPQLRHLDVWFGMPGYGGDAILDDIAPLLARRDLTLTHLGLRNAMFTDELCELLARSPLLPRLVTLDMSLGTLSDDGARTLAQYAAAFAHLHRLDVSKNYLTDAGRAAIARLCANVDTSDQSDPDEAQYGRYPSVGE